MKREIILTHEFVEFLPNELQEGTIYLSMTFATAAHKCVCGCGNDVITPLSPTDWQLLFDGESVSLTPSIGNWNFPCHSHYWIRHNKVQWARQWSQHEIDAGRTLDRRAKQQYYDETPAPSDKKTSGDRAPKSKGKREFWRGLRRRFFQE